MKWEKYKKEFTKKAELSGYSENEISDSLEYAYKLFVDRGLPIIFDDKHFAMLVGYDLQYLYGASNSPKKYYRVFHIDKKNGEKREISEPLPGLKEIQQWILAEILYKCNFSAYAKAFIPKRSIRHNARLHKNQNKVLSIDIKNFFGSIRPHKVYGFFNRHGYSKQVSGLITCLCCLDRALPQGAPTSPALSNLIFLRADARIAGFTNKHGIRYTRYADDLSFSGEFNEGMVIKFIESVLKDEELEINSKKTRLMHRHQRQEVTGVVVNNKLQAPRGVRRKLRQEVYFIEKYGLPSHLDTTENYRANYIKHLLGIANYITFINPKDTEVGEYINILHGYLVK
jgi:RNA-directed DNA polymerase